MKKLLLFLLFPISIFSQDTITSTKDTVGIGESAILTASVPVSHHWSTGATTSFISVNTTVTTIFYDTIKGNSNTIIKNKTIVVDSNSFDSDAVVYFDSCSSAGFPVTSAYKSKYNNFILYLKSHSNWSGLDCQFLFATGNENWAKRDVKKPSRTITLQSSYAGRFAIDTGYNGNGSFAIITNYNPGDGGAYNFTQNNSTVGCLLAYNRSVTPAQELSATNSTGANGIVVSAFPNGVGYLNSNFTLAGSTYQKYRFNSRGWFGAIRTGSTSENIYWNGVKTCTQVVASNSVLNQKIGLLGSYHGTFSAGLFSSNTVSAFYAGNSTLSQQVQMDAFNFAFNGILPDYIYRVIFEGDSRTGSVGASSASVSSAYPKAVMAALGNGWCSALVSESGEKLQQITTQYSTEIQPFRDTNLSKDIIVLWAATNDFASNRTAAQVYADLVSFCTQAHSNGFKIVIVGDIARGTYTTAQQTASITYTNTLLTDFSTNVSTNIYSGGSYADYYINLVGDSVFQNAGNTTYYQVDGIHLNTTGYGLAAPYIVTAIQLF